MRIIITAIFILLPAIAFARDGIVIPRSTPIQYLYHIRGAEEVGARCQGRLGCFDQVRLHPRIVEVWLVDDMKVAVYLCGHIAGRDQNISDAEIDRTYATLYPHIPDGVAPTPLCFADRLHTDSESSGILQSAEQWEKTGSRPPIPTGEMGRLRGSIVSLELQPIRDAKIIARRAWSEAAVAIRADKNGQFDVQIPVGLYALRLTLDNGYSEGPWMIAVGPEGRILDWIIGLSD